MSILNDPSLVRPQCHGKAKPRSLKGVARDASVISRRSVLKSISIPSFSSVLRTSLTWAGDAWSAYGDGLSQKQRKLLAEAEDRKQVLYLKKQNAVTYDEWREAASELDALENNTVWKQTFDCPDYDPDLVQERLKQLEDARISCDISRMLFLIRTSLSRHLGNMSNAALYKHSHLGTKDLVDRYITTALDTISSLVESSGKDRCDGLESKYILDQLLAARQAFGRSALLFSGGATFGMNHIGVLKALYEANLLPRIISGASAGSIVCAVFCTRTEDELPALLDTYAYGDFDVFGDESKADGFFRKMTRLMTSGSFLDITHLANVMRCWLGDMTFQEAYNRTRRILNVCVSSVGIYELPKLLNYITAPNVLIWSAVAVSCSVPFVFEPFTLMTKDPLTGEPVPWCDYEDQYIDGSVDGDLPMNRLSEMFNVNHFIVSQVNPHVVPFLPKDDGPDRRVQASFTAPRWLLAMTHLAKDELLHRMTVMSELGIFPTHFTKTVSIVNQRYFGDINIYPEIQLSQVPVMLKNPTTEFMLNACLSGERATWPKLGRIRNHCAIELALDSAIQEMRARVAFHPSRINVKLDSMVDHSLESLDSSGGRGRLLNRRSSYNHELEKTKHMRHIPSRQTRPYLQRSRSVLLSEQSRSIDSVTALKLDQGIDQRTKGHQNSSLNTGDGSYATGSDSDEESGASPSPLGNYGSLRSHVSWEPSSEDHPFAWSSLDGSANSSQSFASAHSRGSSHRASALSPQTSHAVRTMPEKSLSPPRHHLRMTPSAYVRSPNSGRFLN
ncbi:patatin-domain-containing protein [Aspergillus sclerotioniger CBS 115572]|uniref:Patatin-like phospholipase domain-containing protein n=1 Tax=Aspergillus sclerotioniger CBS 115572 TaxID=1450535 RepID=A0A317X7I6_9EURO|nr:patatin-domain-containing protein [Aspergillus sclerotioniger CBS 115572]PWY93517.1 patatin-domain-containing protein [Aspergillus sclerotioniger CBS 115572]